ncbi:MAG: radical SAM protein [Thermomicrobiales bacterium]
MKLLRLVGLFAQSGFTKLRLTGGEPTIRPHVEDLIREMKAFPGIEEISMTTNGLLLPRMAADLREAGLDRINVSIDTLDPVRFKFMTRGGRLDLVLAGIEEAERVGIGPISSTRWWSAPARTSKKSSIWPRSASTNPGRCVSSRSCRWKALGMVYDESWSRLKKPKRGSISLWSAETSRFEPI